MAREKKYIDDDEEFSETSIYDGDGRKDLVDDDEMSAEEEGFMRGYEEADKEVDEVDAEPEEKEEF